MIITYKDGTSKSINAESTEEDEDFIHFLDKDDEKIISIALSEIRDIEY